MDDATIFMLMSDKKMLKMHVSEILLRHVFVFLNWT